MVRTFHRTLTLLALTTAALGAQAQTAKPQPQPSPSPAAVSNNQSSQLPAGADTGVPGSAQNPAVRGNLLGGDNTRREVLRDRALAASGPRDGIDDSAAAKLAARSGGAKPAKVAARPASGAASNPGPSPKR